MFKEEKYIEKQFGKANHFNVPKGYFEGFTSKMMQNLPVDGKEEASSTPVIPISAKHGFWSRYRRVIGGVAASVCIAMFSVGAFMHFDNKPSAKHDVQQAQMVVAPQQHSDSSIDEFVNYTMMDTDDMYAYMADAI